jgi:hypothetical protein
MIRSRRDCPAARISSPVVSRPARRSAGGLSRRGRSLRLRPLTTHCCRSSGGLASALPRWRLIGAVLDPNILDAPSEHSRECRPRISPVADQSSGPPPSLPGLVVRKNTPNPNYISMSLWGVFGEPALGGLWRASQCGKRRHRSLQSAPVEGPRPAPLDDQAISIGQYGISGPAQRARRPPRLAGAGSAGSLSSPLSLSAMTKHRPEMGWVPQEMDGPPVPWQDRRTLH